jgi:hypothetical protein
MLGEVNRRKVVEMSETMKRGSNAAHRLRQKVRHSLILLTKRSSSGVVHYLFAAVRNSVRIFSYNSVHESFPTEV